jgi:hypothetical protein
MKITYRERFSLPYCNLVFDCVKCDSVAEQIAHLEFFAESNLHPCTTGRAEFSARSRRVKPISVKDLLWVSLSDKPLPHELFSDELFSDDLFCDGQFLLYNKPLLLCDEPLYVLSRLFVR